MRGHQFRVQYPGKTAVIASQFLKQGRAEGELVTAGQRFDLAGVAEAGTHDDGVQTAGLEGGEDVAHGDHAGVLFRGFDGHAILAVPVENAAYKGGDQCGAGFGGGQRLSLVEHQRHITANAFFFQNLHGADAFPAGCYLDQDAAWIHVQLPVDRHQSAAFLHGGAGVKRQAGIDLTGYQTRHTLQDGLSGQAGIGIGEPVHFAFMAQSSTQVCRLLEQIAVTRVSGSCQ